jgi:hypothetical protein
MEVRPGHYEAMLSANHGMAEKSEQKQEQSRCWTY